MATRQQAIPILRTKLHRPPVGADFICRSALHAKLDEGRHFPLSLLSAPAGYGKSTVISHWLETCGYPSAWLSLEETDSDLRVFVNYVVAAVQTVASTACQETLKQLQADELPLTEKLANLLSNDLDVIGEPFILALDDYHHIRDPSVHELVNRLLEHPPRDLHLTILSRRDPPLSLGKLRAGNMMTEIRAQDLQFTEIETAAFLKRAVGRSVDSSALKHLQEKTEGWPVALRLAALALQHRSDAEEFIRGFGGDSRQLQEYLVAEILAHQSPETCDCMYRTSILNRFCAPLCQSLGDRKRGSEKRPPRDRTTDQAFLGAGLFCIPLDDRQEWYRYHHLFQELLQRYLETHRSPGEIAALHERAANWFEEQGLLDEAVQHALKGNDPEEAGELIARQHNKIVNDEQWYRLDKWLQRLPPGTGDDNPELLILKAWLLITRARYMEMFKALDRIEELMGSDPLDCVTTQCIQGGVDALRAYQRYTESKGKLAVERAEQALARLPSDALWQRGFAVMVLAGAHQMTGHLGQARQVAYDALAHDPTPSRSAFHTRLLFSLCFVDWMEADLHSLKRTTTRCVEICEELSLLESSMIGQYFVGITHYQLHELAAAEAALLPVISDPIISNTGYLTQIAFALASVHEAQGQSGKATATAEFIGDYLLKIRDPNQLALVQAFQAELALRQGRLAEAFKWAAHFDPEPLTPMYRFYSPQMTLAKALIAQGSKESHDRADGFLTRLEAYLAKIHNTRFLIEVLALQALLRDARGEESPALETLGKAVSLAQPGGSVRLFVDLGAPIAGLLDRLTLDEDEEGQRYVGSILRAYRDDELARTGQARTDGAPAHPVHIVVSAGSQPIPSPLTKRELNILVMLGSRLSNKEIAGRLHIAPATVKRHVESIYGKLDVHGRRAAVAKALELAILGTD